MYTVIITHATPLQDPSAAVEVAVDDEKEDGVRDVSVTHETRVIIVTTPSLTRLIMPIDRRTHCFVETLRFREYRPPLVSDPDYRRLLSVSFLSTRSKFGYNRQTSTNVTHPSSNDYCSFEAPVESATRGQPLSNVFENVFCKTRSL